MVPTMILAGHCWMSRRGVVIIVEKVPRSSAIQLSSITSRNGAGMGQDGVAIECADNNNIYGHVPPQSIEIQNHHNITRAIASRPETFLFHHNRALGDMHQPLAG